jgi:plasmid segregation protein ParM
VIDIGFKTTDYIVVRVGTPIETLEHLSGTIEMGMSHLNRAFSERFLEETGRQADFAQITRYISNGGKFYYNSKEHDLSDSLEVVRNEPAKILKDALISSWGDSFHEYRAQT